MNKEEKELLASLRREIKHLRETNKHNENMHLHYKHLWMRKDKEFQDLLRRVRDIVDDLDNTGASE